MIEPGARRDARRTAGRLLAWGSLLTFAAASVPSTAATGSAPAKSAGQAAAKPARPNLVLITIDSLRGDRLTGDRHDMPNLERLAARAWRFERAYVASPSIGPSHASLLTGLDPLHHGLRHDLEGARLKDGVATLAERLRGSGYQTFAVTGTRFVDSDTRLDRGFDRYDDTFPGIVKLVAGLSKERRASEVVTAARTLLERRDAAKPLFLWLNFHDAHPDFDPPEPFKTDRKDDLYGGELASVDEQLGAILGTLRERGVLDRAALVVASPQGEAMGEHKETGHGVYLYETTVRVPLLVVPPSAPEQGGGSVPTPVSLTDLTPTLLELAGIAVPQGLDGRSFAGLLKAPAKHAKTAKPGRSIFIEAVEPWASYGWAALGAIIEGDRKVVQGKGTYAQAFDLAADPREERPLTGPPGWAKKMGDAAMARLGVFDPISPAKKKEILAAAEAFGTPWADHPFCVDKDVFADPRDPERVPLAADMYQAGIEQDQGIVGRSTRTASKVLETDPDNFRALDMIGFLGIRNRWGSAVLEVLELLQCRYPTRVSGYHYLSHYYEQQGQNDRALQAIDLMEMVDPLSEEPNYDRAVVLARAGKPDEAIAALEKSIGLGANDFTFIQRDPRFGPLRNDPRFRALVGLDPPPVTSGTEPK